MKFALMGLIFVLGVCVGIAKGMAPNAAKDVKTKISIKE